MKSVAKGNQTKFEKSVLSGRLAFSRYVEEDLLQKKTGYWNAATKQSPKSNQKGALVN